jgi:hypothetical protein
MSAKPHRLDTWSHVEAGASVTTTVWDGGRMAIINRTVRSDGQTRETFLPIAYGDELDRLIAALEEARKERP